MVTGITNMQDRLLYSGYNGSCEALEVFIEKNSGREQSRATAHCINFFCIYAVQAHECTPSVDSPLPLDSKAHIMMMVRQNSKGVHKSPYVRCSWNRLRLDVTTFIDKCGHDDWLGSLCSRTTAIEPYARRQEDSGPAIPPSPDVQHPKLSPTLHLAPCQLL